MFNLNHGYLLMLVSLIHIAINVAMRKLSYLLQKSKHNLHQQLFANSIVMRHYDLKIREVKKIYDQVRVIDCDSENKTNDDVLYINPKIKVVDTKSTGKYYASFFIEKNEGDNN